MMTVIRVTDENGRKLHEETFTSEIRGTVSITVDTQLAALREAGEKMSKLIEEFLSHDGFSENSQRVATALAEWEAANK